MIKNLFILLIIFNFYGCVSYNVVGKFENYDEVFIGTVDHNLLAGVGDITATGEKSGVTCTGLSTVTYIPAFSIGCKGQRGEAPLQCSDGRTLTVDWIATSCTTGYGSGFDKDGIKFSFTFGHQKEEALAKLDKLRIQTKGKEKLPVYNPSQVREEKGFATGTGFAVSKNGDILTNYHVIEGSQKIMVVDTFSKKEWIATLIKSDPANDVALINIHAQLIPLSFIETKNIDKGEEVFTLGYPLIMIQGQEQKATFGRINSLSGIKDDIRMFQIDVPIQPGNSGGPLINKYGNVVGIVTATLDEVNVLRIAGSLPQNVNFAVKSDYALPLLKNFQNYNTQEEPSDFKDIIKDVEKSIFLIISTN